jgi:fructose-bisphosphate aldolase class I
LKLTTTPDLEKYINGVILYDETFWQENREGINFAQYLKELDILPGIKVDTGAKDFYEFPGEKVTDGLVDLSERLEKYARNGAKFTKWRAVIKIDESLNLPTDGAILENMKRMAEYAKLVQESNMVPIVEPEVLLLGKHNLQKSKEVTEKVIKTLFAQLQLSGVFLPGLILKTSMVISGNENPDENSPTEIAEATVEMLNSCVPRELGGIVFLSGGQTPVEAAAHFDAIVEKGGMPWELAFSFARALQEPALRVWQGKDENIVSARAEFLKRLKLNKMADSAEYDVDLEYYY